MTYSNQGPAILSVLGSEFVSSEKTICEQAEACKKKIIQALCECANMGEGEVVSAGDETYDKAGWVKALRDLYDWLDVKCSESEPVAIITSSSSCVSY